MLTIGSNVVYASPSADSRFGKVAAREWSWRQNQEAGGEDNTAVRPHLPDLSPAAQGARLAYLREVLRELDGISRDSLSVARQADYDVYRFQIETMVERLRFREYEKPLNADSSFWTDIGFVARGTFKTERDYRNWLTQMRELPRYFDQQIANMRAGAARGFTPPAVTLKGREATVSSVAAARSPEETLFYEPFRTMPAVIPAPAQAALRSEAKQLINALVIPAYAKLLKYLRAEYIPAARKTLAAEALPAGHAYYRSLVREFTTTNLTPAEIHAIGVAEVDKLHAEMVTEMRKTGFSGSFPAFLQMLRSDPRFYATSEDQLLREAAWITKQIDGKLPLYFGHLPRQRFTVLPVPADLAPSYTAGRGGPGAYLVNTYDLRSRPLYSLRALTLHEAAPGHAFQMPLARENTQRPEFRRNYYFNAYGEGWALYCEWLGDEMGIYETPYDRFGMLSYQMWRAARLVVDTGIHSKGWTREQAQAFLSANTALSPREVETEVDRYISWPGQALAYYLGERAIRSNRLRAETALGAKFNIRAFHDAILELGGVPLPVLDRRIDRFIAEGGKGPYPEEE